MDISCIEQNTPSTISIVEPSTPEQFEQYYDLRWRILRAPWRQARGSERDEREDESIHLMACDNANQVIAVGRLHLNSPQQAQIRFMAVETEHQREGIGSKLLFALEEKAKALGAEEIIFEARANIAGFYKRYGYKTIAPGNTLFGSIYHYKMSKNIKNEQ